MKKYRVVNTPKQCCGVLAKGYEGLGERIILEGVLSNVINSEFPSNIIVLDGEYLVWEKDVIEVLEIH